MRRFQNIILAIGASCSALTASLAEPSTPTPRDSTISLSPEVVPPFGPALEDRIRNRPASEAKVTVNPAGAVQLEVNGQVEPLMVGGIKGFVAHDKMRVKVWKDAGYNLVFVYYDLGYMCSRFGYVSPTLYNRSFWDGPNRYVREDVEKVLWRVLKVYPNAKIILWPWIDVYPGWAEEHPDELMRNDQGQGIIVKSHFERPGDNPKMEDKERLAWSFFSEVFRKDTGEMLREFVHTVETSLPGKQVVGYILGGGQDAQLYAWDPPDYSLQENPSFWADYSKPALRAWKIWLEKTYQTPAKLSEAWGFPVASFAEAQAPKAINLVGPQAYHDPLKEKQEIDWLRFMAEGRADLCSHFAAVVRKEVRRPVLVGVSGGDGGARYAMTATGKLLRDPNIDLLFHQATYGAERRLPPSTGGINAMLGSHSLHRKLFLADMDQRTWISKSLGGTTNLGVITFSDRSVGRATNMDQLRSMWRREIATLWANGAGPLWHPLVDPDTYEDQEIKDELKFLREQAPGFVPSSAKAESGEVAVIYDEQSISYLKGALAKRHGEWTDVQQSQLNASGVPYRLYYADDLREGLIPPAKMYIFVNLLNLDAPLRAAIDKLKANGTTLVWMQASGFAQAAQPELVGQAIGLALKPLVNSSAEAGSKSVMETSASLSIKAESLSRDLQGGWRVDDPQARALGFYSGTGEVGAAMREHDHWRTIFIGSHVLDSQLINSLAEIAEAWRLAPAGNVVSAGEGWVSIQPLKEGKVSLHLREPAPLKALWPETINEPMAAQHALNLAPGTTYIFKTE